MNRQQALEAMARCEAATKGPWGIEPHDGDAQLVASGEVRRIVAVVPHGGHIPDRRFLCCARTDLPAALKMLTEAMELLAFEHSQGFPVRPECDCRNCSNRRSMDALLREWEGR